MTFEKEKREVRGTPSSTSLSIYRLCVLSVSTQFRASPFERALFSALNRVSLKN